MINMLFSKIFALTHKICGPFAKIGVKAAVFCLIFVRWLPFVNSRLRVMSGSKDKKIIENTDGYFGGESIFKDSNNALLRGNLMLAAEQRWPKSRFAQYWLDAPVDMRRHVITDGYLADGSDPSTELSAMYVTDDLIKDSVEKALILSHENAKRQLGIMCFIAVAIPLFIFIIMSSAAFVSAKTVDDSAADFLLEAAGTGWFTTMMHNVLPKLAAVFESGLRLGFDAVFAGLSFLVLMVCAVMLSHARFWRDFWNLHRSFIKSIADSVSADLRNMPKEAVTRYNYRAEDRREENLAYVKSVEAVNSWDSRDGVVLGTATGKFAFRGHLSAPQPAQDVVLTNQARAQHILVFGASGLGKTTKILKPLFKKDVKSIIDGHVGSIYVSDGKGDLYKDLGPIARKAGLKTVVIGIQEGSVGLDLLQGTKPQLVADILASVLKQSTGASGGGSDPFWNAMRDHFIRCAATILEAYERTTAGVEWSRVNGRRCYSLLNIYRLTQQKVEPGSQIWEMIDAIKSEYANPVTFFVMQDLATEGLWGSIEYVFGKWHTMSLNSPSTLDGVQANITASLSQFETQEGILKNFASGEASGFSISEMFSEPMAVFTDLNSVDSGICGKIVLIFIKTLVYLELRKRQMRDSSLPKLHSFKVYFDEVQEIITADFVGVSDINFINIARSAMGPGGGFVVATQTANALEMIVGKVPASNYIDNFSTIISMRQNDPATSALFKQRAGKTMRYHLKSSNEIESFEGIRQITGVDVLKKQTKILADIDVIRKAAIPYCAKTPSLDFSSYKAPFEADYRFLPKQYVGTPDGKGYSDNTTSYLGALAAAEHRAEDKSKEYFSGAVLEDVLTDADFSQLGDTKAVAVWVRGGHVKMDIIDLPEPVFN